MVGTPPAFSITTVRTDGCVSVNSSVSRSSQSADFSGLLTLFQERLAAGRNLGCADIDEERSRLRLARGDAHALQHQTAQFGFDVCHGAVRGIAQRYRNFVVSLFGDANGKIERLLPGGPIEAIARLLRVH